MRDKQEKIDTLNARANEVISGLVSGLKNRGHDVVTRQEPYAKGPSIITVDDVYIGLRLSFERTSTSTWTVGSLNGKLRMSMRDGDYKRKSYPEPKVGFVNSKTLDRIENVLQSAAAIEAHRSSEAVRKETALYTLQAVASGLALEEKWGEVNGKGYTLKADTATHVHLTASVTFEQMVRIAEILGE